MNTLSIADALFPKVAQRVLAALYGNPDRSYYTKELIRQVDSGSGAVHRELIKLTAAGLVSVRALAIRSITKPIDSHLSLTSYMA